MGTYYELYECDGVEIGLGEMSNKIELMAFDNEIVVSTGDLEPSEMLKIFMEGIKNTSYWMSKEKFEETFSKLEVYPY